jgi:hypothetical protein
MLIETEPRLRPSSAPSRHLRFFGRRMTMARYDFINSPSLLTTPANPWWTTCAVMSMLIEIEPRLRPSSAPSRHLRFFGRRMTMARYDFINSTRPE